MRSLSISATAPGLSPSRSSAFLSSSPRFEKDGFGALDEMFESLTLIQTHRIKHFPTILVDSGHWAPLLDWLDHDLEDDGMIAPADRELLVTADTPREVCTHVRRASSKQKELAAA